MLFLLLPAVLLFCHFVPTFFIFRVICLGSNLYPLPCDVISSALPTPMILFSLPLQDPLPYTCTLWALIMAPCSLPFTHMGLTLFRCSLSPPGFSHTVPSAWNAPLPLPLLVTQFNCHLLKAARPGLLLWKDLSWWHLEQIVYYFIKVCLSR